MSCVTFLTDEQRRQLSLGAADPTPVSTFRSPPVTAAMLRRIRLLARDSRPGIRASAAAHPHAPGEVLHTLAKDGDVRVRVALARNAWAPVEVLAALAQDPDPGVRQWVAVHERASGRLRAELGTDPDPQVRDTVRWVMAATRS